MRRGLSVLALAALLFTNGCATQPAKPLPLETGAEQWGVMHTLVKGETVWRLAETYGVKADEILRANRIKNPSDLKVGTRIWVPGARHPLRILPFLPDANRWQYILIHHSATEIGNAELFDKGHRRRGFWNGLGYHFVIDNGSSGTRDGQIETSHRWIHQMDGAHCNASDMNKIGIGICLVGNFDTDAASPYQISSLAWLVRQLQAKYKIPASRVLRHSDVPGKDTHCPGAKFPWSEFRKQLL
jgi:LysM repeat protein